MSRNEQLAEMIGDVGDTVTHYGHTGIIMDIKNGIMVIQWDDGQITETV